MKNLLIILTFLFILSCSGDTTSMPTENNKDREKWDKKYNTDTFIYGKEPCSFLKENIKKLPQGNALDIAAGEGRNAVFLAENNYNVDAVDISAIGLEKAATLATQRNTKINTIVADLTKYKIKENHYDVIVNFYYLQRDLFPQIRKGLKVGGVVVFETFNVDHLKINSKMKREYCLEKEELLNAFRGFKIVEYKETQDRNKAISRLIARKK